jgi:hypothetical protein
VNIKKLVEHFSTYTVAPIDPDDVADQIRSYGVQDQISFIGVTLDTLVLRGAFYQYVRSPGVYANGEICVDIYYDVNQEPCWRRLVCCKELLHLLDNSSCKTSTIEDCQNLIDGLSSITSSTDLSPESLAAWADHMTVYYAISILFPWRMRELLFKEVQAGRTTTEQVAQLVDLPLSAVSLVLSDQWPRLYEILAG